MLSGIELVISHYNVGVPLGAMPSRFGTTNLNWIVNTNSGQYFLRRRNVSFTPASIDFGIAILEYLVRVGFPTPRLIRTIDGASRVHVGGGNWELYEFVGGENFRVENLAQVASAGRLLARYHRTVAALTGPEKILSDSLRRSADGKNTVEADALPTNSRAHLLPCLSTIARRFGMGNALTIRDRTDWTPFVPGLSLPIGRPKILVHGDFSPFNIIFRKDEAIALCDYDSSRFFYRSFDLASAIVQFGLLSPNYRGEIDRQSSLNIDRVGEFVRAYKSNFPLNRGELLEALMMIQVAFRLDLIDIILGDYSLTEKVGWLAKSARFKSWMRDSSEVLIQAMEN